MSNDMDQYIESWVILLTELGHWSESDAREWSVRRREAFEGNPFLEHEPASWYVIPVMISDSVRRRAGNRLIQLQERLTQVLQEYLGMRQKGMSAEELAEP